MSAARDWGRAPHVCAVSTAPEVPRGYDARPRADLGCCRSVARWTRCPRLNARRVGFAETTKARRGNAPGPMNRSGNADRDAAATTTGARLHRAPRMDPGAVADRSDGKRRTREH